MTTSTRLIGALTTLFVLAVNSAPALARGGPRSMDGPLPIEKMAKRLDLDEQQVASLRALQDANVRATIEVDGRIAYAEYQLRTQLQADTPDRAAIFDQVDALALLHAEKRKLQVGARLDSRAVLTEEQREKAGRHLDRLMDRRGERGDRERRGRRFEKRHERGQDRELAGDAEPLRDGDDR